MNMSEELLERFDKFVEGLGNLGEYTWEITVKQMFIEGITYTAVGIGILIVAGVLLYSRRWVDGAAMPNEDKEVAKGVLVAGSCGVVVVALFVFAYAARLMANPEYYALQEVARMLGLN